MIRIASRTPEVEDDVFYPTGDGKPMAETGIHVMILTDLFMRLLDFYAKKPSVCICANQFLYYEKGNAEKVLAPDCFVAFNTHKHGLRDTFKTWEEGANPAVVFEITSKTTKNEDLKTKFKIYQDVLGVKEYFLFDPFEDYLTPSLQGYRLIRGEFKPIKTVEGVLESKELGITIKREGTELKLFHAKSGRPVLTKKERQLEVERRARRQAEGELKRVLAELEALKRKDSSP